MTKLNVLVHEERVEISQGLGHVMRLPRAYIPELIDTLRVAERTTYFYQGYGVAFGPRSCKLILYNNGSEPHTVASVKPSTVNALIEGLLPHVDECYLRRDQLASRKK